MLPLRLGGSKMASLKLQSCIDTESEDDYVQFSTKNSYDGIVITVNQDDNISQIMVNEDYAKQIVQHFKGQFNW